MVRYLLIMHHQPERYRLSFTFGGLLVPETRIIAETWLRLQDWGATRAAIAQQNLLGKTRASSRKRYAGEIIARLKSAHPWELPALATPEAPVVIYAIVARYYPLIGDVAVQVIRPQLDQGITTLDASLIRAFVADQAPAHRPLQNAAATTREKLISVMIRIFREAGIVTAAAPAATTTSTAAAGTSRHLLELHRPFLSQELHERYCTAGTPRDQAHLLWTDKEIARCTP